MSEVSTSSQPPTAWKALALGALGVVFGDIGTSPLYALREAVKAGGDASEATVYGVVSLIIWALFTTVTLKYVGLLLRADNKGEGGILSLFALAQQPLARHARVVLWLGVGGAAMFLGDALITPAISVLSAVEGLTLANAGFEPYVVPLSLLILLLLFAAQRKGTGVMGTWFGPIMLCWFALLAGGGVLNIIDNPGVLKAINPNYAVHFLVNHGHTALLAAGAVFLAVTGAEAMYTDLGHFGRTPIRRAWLLLVFPALLLNYMGQAALVVARPETMENPFFFLLPPELLIPVILMATAATIIASQAVITGAFSLAHQAVALGLIPRLEFLHTSDKQSGQIYCPKLNRWLAVGILLLVAGFGSSANLAHAYGIAVATNMLLTCLLLFMVMRLRWHRSMFEAMVLVVPFILIDLGFWCANILKLESGAWLPLTIGLSVSVLMVTWVQGSKFLYQRTVMNLPALDRWMRALDRKKLARVPGMAVWLVGDTQHAPIALLHNIRHNDVLHQHNVVLNIRTLDVPRVPHEQRVAVVPIDKDFSRMQITFGYMESPDIPAAMVTAHMGGLLPATDGQPVTYFLTHRSLKASPHVGLPLWQDHLFIGMSKLAEDATDFYKLPPEQVVEVGVQVEM
ncbi:MAG TPA: KUP/HAK/KT family potassium transporter [Alphaproteobacteria bacterium]|nr:KUP/HAK/KT family potassium transporter [Alphaproteobacteria bacterium]